MRDMITGLDGEHYLRSDLDNRWCSESVETSLNETPKFKAIDK
jgi:hypothetical protein